MNADERSEEPQMNADERRGVCRIGGVSFCFLLSSALICVHLRFHLLVLRFHLLVLTHLLTCRRSG